MDMKQWKKLLHENELNETKASDGDLNDAKNLVKAIEKDMNYLEANMNVVKKSLKREELPLKGTLKRLKAFADRIADRAGYLTGK